MIATIAMIAAIPGKNVQQLLRSYGNQSISKLLSDQSCKDRSTFLVANVAIVAIIWKPAFSASLRGLSQLVRKQGMSQYTEIEELEADCHPRYTRFTLVKAASDELQPPEPASGQPAGKAKRPKSSSGTTIVVRQTRRNKSSLHFN